MRKITRSVLVPALTAASLLTAGCSAAGPSAQSAGDAGPTTTATSPAPRQLDVEAAPAGDATPTAVARAGGGKPAVKSSLKVASYDRRSGRAVISGKGSEPKPSETTADGSDTTPRPSPTDSSGTTKDVPVAAGDLIASAPAPGAPDGVLAKVTEVVGETEKGTEVATAPTTLGAVLGEDKADGRVPVDPASVKVKPLVNGVKVSWAKTGDVHFGPEGAKLPMGSLRLDVGASVATAKGAPASAAASVKGFVQLAPQVEFGYDGSGSGSGTSPGAAFLGLTGDWSSQWALKGRAAGATEHGKPLRVPFAELHTDPVIYVGPVPVVVNLDLTCYLQVDGDGRISVDVKQNVKGAFRVGGNFSWAKGWTPVSTSTVKGVPLKTSVAAAGKVKAALGAEASIGLYGTVGVTADFAPYLRGEAASSATGSSDGDGSALGAWKLFGGLDLRGTLRIQLSIFGTPIFRHDIPLGTLHREWRLAEGKGSAITTGPRGS